MRPAETRLSTTILFRRPRVLLAVCWLLVQTSLFINYGIFAELESIKYIVQAEHLIENGTVTTSNFWLYSTQIFLIAASKLLGTGLASVVVVQLFFNGLATLALYRLAASLSNTRTAVIVGLIFIFTVPVQMYNFFLQTESLFFSFTILFSCYLLRLQRLSTKSILILLGFLALISITRPSGLLWIPCAFIFIFFRFFKGLRLWIKTGITIIAGLAFLIVLDSALGSGGELDFMLPFRDERIICGVPTLPGFVEIDTAENPNSVYGLAYYVTHNFGQFSRLVWIRTKAFFGLHRDYYGNLHNAYLIIYFFPFYFLALYSVRNWMKRNANILLYCVLLIAVTWGTVILTCDDWHNRFFFTVVPYFYILSIPTIDRITKYFRRNADSRIPE